MTRQPTYGQNIIGPRPPRSIKLRVRVAEVQGTKQLRSKSFTIYGTTYEELLEAVESLLRGNFDD